MRVSARQDIRASLEQVYRAMTDFERHEGDIQSHGADLNRLHPDRPLVPGNGWHATFDFRGKTRKVKALLSELRPNEALHMEFEASSVTGTLEVDLSEHEAGSRMVVALEVRPVTIKGRLLVQSMKLAKGEILERLQQRLASFAVDVESDGREIRSTS